MNILAIILPQEMEWLNNNDWIWLIWLLLIIAGALWSWKFNKKDYITRSDSLPILTESQKYIITSEYETVFLTIKENGRIVTIGDFYGDVEKVVISDDERFCVMGGCGLIIYYLHEPYQEYCYNTTTTQWKELYRENGGVWWIDDIEYMDNSAVEISVENGNKYRLDVYSLDLVSLIRE